MSAMGDYINVCTKDVYIPRCGEHRCCAKLTKIAELLEKNGCQCVDEFNMSGLWKEQFFENFLDSCYTVIHKCPSLFEQLQVSDVLDTILKSRMTNRIVYITLKRHSSFAKKQPAQVDNINEILKGLQIQVVSDGKSMTDFVLKFLKMLGKNDKVLPPLPCKRSSLTYYSQNVLNSDGYINNPDSDKDVFQMLIRQLSWTDSRAESVQDLNIFPDEFGLNDAQEVFARTERTDDFGAALVHLTNLPELRQHIDAFKDNQQTMVWSLMSVLYKILPALYETRSCVGLAHIVLCNQPVLQNRAMTFLELLIFQGLITMDIGKLQETELMLTTKLVEMSMNYKKSSLSHSGLQKTMERLCNLILMMHCQTMTCFNEKGNNSDSFNNVVREILSVTSDHGVHCINTIVNLLQSPKCLQEKAQHFIEYDALRAKELLKQNTSIQIFVVFDCLMKICSRSDLQVLHFLTFLKKYLKDSWLPFQKVPSLCSQMIFHGMTLFLAYFLKAAVHADIHSVCCDVLDILEKTFSSCSYDEGNKILCKLLFDKTPPIKQGVIHLFKKRKHYCDKRLPYLILDEIKSMLCPLVATDPEDKVQHMKSQWRTILGRFGHQKVIILFHVPSERDHWESRKMRFIKHEDIMHQNQINKLQNLRHPLIMSLLAYQLNSLPKFYILEDYTTRNLQMVLKNGNDNKGYFSRRTLLKFLGDAAEALEFCHKSDIIHRNLTAASLFITGDEQRVKLGGFQLSVTKDRCVGKTIENDISEVPTRWSAPESLRKFKFSKASDVWMFAHLMYEVLTHGVLPYSHLDLSDELLVKKLFLDISHTMPVQLFPETCFKRDHYILILRCANFYTSERPNITTIVTQLRSFYNQTTDRNGSSSYPSLTDGKRQPSTSMKKGIPDGFCVPIPSSLNFIKCCTRMLTQYQLDEVFIFREIITGRNTEALISIIQTGGLDEIIPWIQCNKASSGALVIDCYIPASCGLCMLDQTTERTLGNTLQSYLNVLLQVAVMLKKLHDEGVILGDMCASTIFLDNSCENIKILVASLAFASESNCRSQPPTDKTVCQRAAPEVKSHGLYSPASDLFCFGHLIKEVVALFDHHLIEPSPRSNETNKKRALELNDPKGRIMELIRSCVRVDMHERPKMEEVIDEIKRIIIDFNDVDKDYTSIVSLSSPQEASEVRGEILRDTRDRIGTGYGTESPTKPKKHFEANGAQNKLHEKVDKYNISQSCNNSNTVEGIKGCMYDTVDSSCLSQVVPQKVNFVLTDEDHDSKRSNSQNEDDSITLTMTQECMSKSVDSSCYDLVRQNINSELIIEDHDRKNINSQNDDSITLIKTLHDNDKLAMQSKLHNNNVYDKTLFNECDQSITYLKEHNLHDDGKAQGLLEDKHVHNPEYDILHFEDETIPYNLI